MKPPDDVLAPEAIADPGSFFRRLREEDPVYWSERHGVYILTGYRDVHSAFRDRNLSSAGNIAGARQKLEARYPSLLRHALELLDGWMLFNDPPAHTRLREPVRRAFTPAVASSLESTIESRVDNLLDGLNGEVDIVEDFAHPLTALVICDLLGVADSERIFLRGWTQDFGKLIYGASSRNPEYIEAVARAGDEFQERMTPFLARRRTDPRDDLTSKLLASSQSEGWTEPELLGAASMLLFAGHDTTSAAIASATRALLCDPGARRLFTEDPKQRVASAVEELLRFDGPAKIFMRTATQQHDRGGHTIEAGQHLWLSVLGANWDPSVFDQPEQLLIDREPNPHIAFGGGIHFCLGAALARTEMRVALPRLFERFPEMTIATDELRWNATVVDRSLQALPVIIR